MYGDMPRGRMLYLTGLVMHGNPKIWKFFGLNLEIAYNCGNAFLPLESRADS